MATLRRKLLYLVGLLLFVGVLIFDRGHGTPTKTVQPDQSSSPTELSIVAKVNGRDSFSVKPDEVVMIPKTLRNFDSIDVQIVFPVAIEYFSVKATLTGEGWISNRRLNQDDWRVYNLRLDHYGAASSSVHVVLDGMHILHEENPALTRPLSLIFQFR